MSNLFHAAHRLSHCGQVVLMHWTLSLTSRYTKATVRWGHGSLSGPAVPLIPNHEPITGQPLTPRMARR